MSRVGVLILGPAGVGKAHIVNLDPAAEPGEYEFEFEVDIRDLISLQDVMEEMGYGPNGGLVYCFEFLLNNLDWLDEEIGDYDQEYLIFDCPGQIELYTHIPVLPNLIKHLSRHLNFSLCACYLLEASFVLDRPKFFSGVLSAMSAMILLETPHINILSKMDLVAGDMKKRELKRYLNPDPLLMAQEANSQTNPKFHELNKSIANLIDDFGMVQFLPLFANSTASVASILSYIDEVTQWAEAQEPKEPKDEIAPAEEGDE